jgi:acyl-CoA reductase-like NAD-dependent aldehyde dehydrogenase
MGNSKGRFYLPTVLTNVSPSMRVVKEETFGPVLVVIPVDSDIEAIRQANDTAYGLTGSVWTGDTQRGLALARQMRVGHASVNDHVMSASAPNVPWGGNGESGYGRTRGRQGLLEMTSPQVISSKRGITLPREFFWYPYSPLKKNLMRRAIDLLYADNWRDKLRALLP